MTLQAMFDSIKIYGFIIDAPKYEIGDISEKTGLQKVDKGEWREPKDKNGLSFIKNSEGSLNFGEINEEQAEKMGLPSAPIRMSEGSATTYGLKHIEARHGDEIRNAGYSNIESFVEDIVKNFNEIHKGKESERNGEKVQGFYLVKTTNKGIIGIELEKNEDDNFYTINNGGVFGSERYLKNKEILWVSSQKKTSSKGID